MGICVFWYPTILLNHSDKVKPHRFSTEQVINDFGDPLVLSIKIDKKKSLSKDLRKELVSIKSPITINLYTQRQDGTTSSIFLEFKLNYKNHSLDGMVAYEYDKPSDYPSQYSIDFDCFIASCCYSHVKSLFSDHYRDSNIKAYIPTPNKPFRIESIKEKNNEVLKHYIHQYEELFGVYFNFISLRLRNYNSALIKYSELFTQYDENNYSYINLVDDGWRGFKQWCYAQENQKKFEVLKKNILKWSLTLNPQKGRINRNISSYIKRLETIQKKIQQVENCILSCTETNEAEDIIYKTSMAVNSIHRIANSDRHRRHKTELLSLNSVLSEIELKLGIFHPSSFIYHIFPLRYFYKELHYILLNIYKPTNDTRNSIVEMCNEALSEYVYCKTLLEYHYDSNKKTTDDINDRITSFNIRNAIYYFETTKHTLPSYQPIINNLEEQKRKEELIKKIATWLTIFGIIISVISIGVTVWCTYTNINN